MGILSCSTTKTATGNIFLSFKQYQQHCHHDHHRQLHHPHHRLPHHHCDHDRQLAYEAFFVVAKILLLCLLKCSSLCLHISILDDGDDDHDNDGDDGDDCDDDDDGDDDGDEFILLCLLKCSSFCLHVSILSLWWWWWWWWWWWQWWWCWWYCFHVAVLIFCESALSQVPATELMYKGKGVKEVPFHFGKLQRLDSISARSMVPSSVHLKIILSNSFWIYVSCTRSVVMGEQQKA